MNHTWESPLCGRTRPASDLWKGKSETKHKEEHVNSNFDVKYDFYIKIQVE